MMNLWIDDVREPPDASWAVARTYQDAWDLLRRYAYDVVSFDHDLGDEIGQDTGYDLLVLIENGALNCPREIRLHSMNPVGRQRMATVVDALRRRGTYEGP